MFFKFQNTGFGRPESNRTDKWNGRKGGENRRVKSGWGGIEAKHTERSVAFVPIQKTNQGGKNEKASLLVQSSRKTRSRSG